MINVSLEEADFYKINAWLQELDVSQIPPELVTLKNAFWNKTIAIEKRKQYALGNTENVKLLNGLRVTHET